MKRRLLVNTAKEKRLVLVSNSLFIQQQKKHPPSAGRKRSRSPSPGRGFDRHGNLIGAAKAAHEAKMAREQGKDNEVC